MYSKDSSLLNSNNSWKKKISDHILAVPINKECKHNPFFFKGETIE